MAVTDQLLARDAVITGLDSVSKTEAIEYVGSLLVKGGHINPDYVAAMLEREESVSTFLGNGVAMPHGTFESRDEIISTGIVVAQFPNGVDWGVGTAHLVIGLAAVGDDHVAILSHIAEVLQDEETAEALWTTTDADHLFQTLGTVSEEDDDEEEEILSVGRTVTISGEGGLHARPASFVVDFAKSFDGTITISKDGKTAKATSIMSVLSLGAVANDVVDVVVEGAGSEAAADEIERILTTPEGEL